jgi:predicted metal-binding protein
MGTLVADLPTHPAVLIRGPVVTPRLISRLRVLIVCGDCAGDRSNPRKTLMAANGTCADCGGRSFVVASKLQIKTKGKEPDECESD